jgi:hypothetical protein
LSPLSRQTATDELERIVAAVARGRALLGEDAGDYVGCELPALDRALSVIRAEGLARGTLFCEWGSGLGGGCAVAVRNGFRAVGIEIRGDLVALARTLARELSLPMVFAEGSFLLPGDEEQATATAERTCLRFEDRAWDELALRPPDCDVVFAYPWPAEEYLIEAVFSHGASPGALLLTFHDRGRVLAQRKLADQSELRVIGWL